MDTYLTNYHILEREVLLLSEYVYFSDKNLGVYSTRISDLIIRLGVEFEYLLRKVGHTQNIQSDDNIFALLKKLKGKGFDITKKGLFFTFYDSSFSNCRIKPIKRTTKEIKIRRRDYYNLCKHHKYTIGKDRSKKPLLYLIEGLASVYLLSNILFFLENDNHNPTQNTGLSIWVDSRKSSGIIGNNMFYYSIRDFENYISQYNLNSKFFTFSYSLYDTNNKNYLNFIGYKKIEVSKRNKKFDLFKFDQLVPRELVCDFSLNF